VVIGTFCEEITLFSADKSFLLLAKAFLEVSVGSKRKRIKREKERKERARGLARIKHRPSKPGIAGSNPAGSVL
jgi:hypothetical protein